MTLKQYAIAYRKFGWNVIPLFECSKNPSHVKWKEYQERFATEQEIEDWFSLADVTGLGVITGKISGIVVVDEDSYKANGMKFEFESPMVSKTARGGRHHFFKYTEPIKSSGFRQGVNIEIKADGGFLVLPPTIVEINATTHETSTYEWLKKTTMAKLPTITEVQLLPYRGGITASGAVELVELLNAQTGTRHNNLRTFALVVFNRFSEKEWQAAEDFVRYEAMKQDPPLRLAEVERIILDVKDYVKQHPKDAKKEANDVVNKKEWKPASINDLAEERIADRRLEETAPKTGWPELDDLIKGFIPGHIYTLTGDTNVGKTTIAANFTEALRAQKKKVLYIALEPDVNLVEYLASVRTRKPFHEVSDNDLRTIKGDEYVQVFLGRDISKVEDLIEAIESMPDHYDLVIIDHIGYFVNSERDWIQKQSNVIKQLAFLAKQQKMAVMMIAHLRKPNKTKKDETWVPTQDDISGSAAFKQDSTEVLIAVREQKPVVEGAIVAHGSGQFGLTGLLMVTKTKVGPNGHLGIQFTEKSAFITTTRQLVTMPEEQQRFYEQRHAEQQELLGDENEDEWNSPN